MSIFKKSKTSSPPEAQASGSTPSDAPPSTPDAAQAPRVKSVQPPKSVGYIKARPGLLRNLWARHPNKTTRKLRKLLVSWEKLGYFLGFAGTTPQVSLKKERAFLKSKVAIAHSTNFLRSVGGAGNVGREAYEMEGEFIRILERCPTLSALAASTREAKRELFHSWHSLYLFLHRLLGAYPYEITGKTATFSLVVPEKLEGAAKKLGPLAERKMA
ncbi:MAG: hypothetical protein AMJ46_02740 [Latescibacteria bacterium DG_63]|nr:MAG: hypothetical protein AMJ46_02740 [Latescibacteria bacterium DG_63]